MFLHTMFTAESRKHSELKICRLISRHFTHIYSFVNVYRKICQKENYPVNQYLNETIDCNKIRSAQLRLSREILVLTLILEVYHELNTSKKSTSTANVRIFYHIHIFKVLYYHNTQRIIMRHINNFNDFISKSQESLKWTISNNSTTFSFIVGK